jgi:peptidyl-prolyl cis-trans isomerase C
MEGKNFNFGKKIILLMVICLFSLGLVSCEKLNFLSPKKKEPPQKVSTPSTLEVKGTIIAKVNNIPITLEELNEEIEAYNAMVPEDKPELKINTREKKIEYLKDQMIRRILLYQEALDRGLDRSETILKALEKTKRDLLVMELVRQEAEKVEVSSKEIEDYYNMYKEEFKEAEERQLREIVVPTEQEAKEILILLLQGQDFATLAKERSKAPSAKDGGDLGFITKGKKFPQFDTVAFSETLEVGKISNIFKGPDGYYILKLEAKRGGKQKSLSEMWDDIKRGLTFLKQQKRIEDLISKLSTQAKIETYESEIK